MMNPEFPNFPNPEAALVTSVPYINMLEVTGLRGARSWVRQWHTPDGVETRVAMLGQLYMELGPGEHTVRWAFIKTGIDVTKQGHKLIRAVPPEVFTMELSHIDPCITLGRFALASRKPTIEELLAYEEKQDRIKESRRR